MERSLRKQLDEANTERARLVNELERMRRLADDREDALRTERHRLANELKQHQVSNDERAESLRSELDGLIVHRHRLTQELDATRADLTQAHRQIAELKRELEARPSKAEIDDLREEMRVCRLDRDDATRDRMSCRNEVAEVCFTSCRSVLFFFFFFFVDAFVYVV